MPLVVNTPKPQPKSPPSNVIRLPRGFFWLFIHSNAIRDREDAHIRIIESFSHLNFSACRYLPSTLI